MVSGEHDAVAEALFVLFFFFDYRTSFYDAAEI